MKKLALLAFMGLIIAGCGKAEEIVSQIGAPQFVSLKTDPEYLSSSGGQVTIYATITGQNVTAYAVVQGPGFTSPQTVNLMRTDNTFQGSIYIPPNTSPSSVTYSITVYAQNPYGTASNTIYLTVYGTTGGPGPGTATVTGRVVDADTGQPVAGATVKVDTLSTTTGTDGRFTLTGVPTGTATLQVSKTGYITYYASIQVQSPTTSLSDIPLVPAGGGPPPPPW